MDSCRSTGVESSYHEKEVVDSISVETNLPEKCDLSYIWNP